MPNDTPHFHLCEDGTFCYLSPKLHESRACSLICRQVVLLLQAHVFWQAQVPELIRDLQNTIADVNVPIQQLAFSCELQWGGFHL